MGAFIAVAPAICQHSAATGQIEFFGFVDMAVNPQIHFWNKAFQVAGITRIDQGVSNGYQLAVKNKHK